MMCLHGSTGSSSEMIMSQLDERALSRRVFNSIIGQKNVTQTTEALILDTDIYQVTSVTRANRHLNRLLLHQPEDKGMFYSVPPPQKFPPWHLPRRGTGKIAPYIPGSLNLEKSCVLHEPQDATKSPSFTLL